MSIDESGMNAPCPRNKLALGLAQGVGAAGGVAGNRPSRPIREQYAAFDRQTPEDIPALGKAMRATLAQLDLEDPLEVP